MHTNWTSTDHDCLLLFANATSGAADRSWILEARFWCMVILLIILNILVLVGNCFVLLALMIDRQLRNPTHYFICSLALADLTLGIFVLPFAAVFQMRGVWIFGSVFCQVWLAIDVWLCTASIYSLIAVTFDRYIAVTKPLTYKSVMTHRRACILIVAVWTVSLIICLPAFALSLNRTYRLASATCQCTQMAHSAVYIAYSSTGSFYLPMIIILYLYARIYATVRRIRLSGNSGVVLTTSPTKKRPKNRRSRSQGRTPSKSKSSKREHMSLIDKGRQLSQVLRVHKGGYHPARKISSGLGRLSAGFRQRTQSPAPVRVVEEQAAAAAPPPNGAECVADILNNASALKADLQVDEEQQQVVLLNGLVREESNLEEATATVATVAIATTPMPRPSKLTLRMNASAKRFLAASCPSSSMNTPRSSVSLDTATCGSATAGRRASNASAALGHELLMHLAMPSQFTTMWCQRMVAFQKYQKKFSLELKALKTVGIVTGCFFLSWLGFCVVYTAQAFPGCRPAKSILNSDFLDLTTMTHTTEMALTTMVASSLGPSIDSCVPDWVINLMMWLGYLNSAINPIIYGISNQQFRRTFRRIMRCGFFKCCEPQNY